ncbi:hypothetical protein [Pseudomonas sp. EYE_354]|uniref:hypothetical protein n=1 Tax=Pseudomonas sp. EYE_354 TaxID=2853449 RepID=UPI002006C1DA|nr:hypothetical protein [Pseudomonas sp. EYE_354]
MDTTPADTTPINSQADSLIEVASIEAFVTPTLDAPELINALPDGLIPTRYLFEDLPVRLKDPWRFLPGEGESDWVTFIWDVQGSVPFELEPIELRGPITADQFPLTVNIPQSYFQNNAVVDLSYRINNLEQDSEAFETSWITTITIDRTAPGGGQVFNVARFLIDPITEFDLTSNTTLAVEVPGDYLDRKTADAVVTYLSGSDTLPTRPANHEQVFNAITGTMLMQVPVSEIRKFAGNPVLYLFYRVRDRAGNTSAQYSLVASATLLINPAPANLSIPEVPAYNADLLVNREDARTIVSVRVRSYTHRLPGDQCVVEWDGIKLPAVAVDTLPFSVPVPWSVLIANGANLRRITNVPVRYYILRAGDTVGPGVRSPLKQVTVDMTVAGQENPQAPILLNRLLALVNIHGAVSPIPNRLDSRDADKPVRASFTLFDNPVPGERALLYWPSRTDPVATYLVKAGDVGGKVVDFDNLIDWQVIKDGNSSASTLVHYRTDNGVNQQLSPDQTVFINLVPPIKYAAPSFPQSLQHPNKYLTCYTQPPIWLGISVLVAPAPNVLMPGDVVILTWQGFLNYPDRNPLPATNETFEYTWAENQTTHEFTVQPYETLIRPLSDYAGGSARYSVFRNNILLGASRVAYVPIDRKHATGNYCGPNGIGPGEK